MPGTCDRVFQYLNSDSFIDELSELVCNKLFIDPTKNFWAIHKYDNGDKLDIHVDVGLHPTTQQKKQITLGIYLSSNWTEENGGHLELWSGENSSNNKAKLFKCEHKVLPAFNRLIMMIIHGMEIQNL